MARTRRPDGVPPDPECEPNDIDGEPAVRWRFVCPSRLRALWRRALELASRAAGGPLADWRAAEIIAAEGSGRPRGTSLGRCQVREDHERRHEHSVRRAFPHTHEAREPARPGTAPDRSFRSPDRASRPSPLLRGESADEAREGHAGRRRRRLPDPPLRSEEADPSLPSGHDRRHAGDQLVCYQAKAASKTIAQTGCGATDPQDKGTKIVPKQPKHEKRLGISVNGPLGPATASLP